MNLRYLLGAVLTAPLLPVLLYQGLKIRRTVPRLPEASGPQGLAGGSYPEEIHLLVLGESTMAGVGVSTHQEGFAGTLATELSERLQKNIRWQVYARSGYTARQVREKLLPRISEPDFDMIVIGLGGNDSFRLNRPARWRSAVGQLVQNLRQRFPMAKIFLANMPPIKAFPAFTPLAKFVIGNLAEILGDEIPRAIRGQNGVYYLNRKITLADWKGRFNLQADDADFFSDGVHPSALTYQTWAREMASFITDKL